MRLAICVEADDLGIEHPAVTLQVAGQPFAQSGEAFDQSQWW
jgi:hypothetical protein